MSLDQPTVTVFTATLPFLQDSKFVGHKEIQGCKSRETAHSSERSHVKFNNQYRGPTAVISWHPGGKEISHLKNRPTPSTLTHAFLSFLQFSKITLTSHVPAFI
jgi:hypothetical protein